MATKTKPRLFFHSGDRVSLMWLVEGCKEITTMYHPEFGDSIGYMDIAEKNIPDKKKFRKWRGNPQNGIWVDETVITDDERRQQRKEEFDQISAKSTPTVKDVKRMVELLREGI